MGHRDYSVKRIEEILISMPVFREASLKLYCDVPVRDIECKGVTYDKVPNLEEDVREAILSGMSVGFLICKENEVLTAIEMAEVDSEHDDCRTQKMPGCSVLKIDAEDIREPDTGDFIEQWIRKKLEEGKEQPCTYTTYVLKPKLQQILVKKYLLEERMLQESRHKKTSEVPVRTPTGYGKSSGIVRGYRATREGRICRRLFASRRACEAVRENLEWNPQAVKALEEKMPLSERLKRLNSGVPSDSTYSVSLLKKFAEISVDNYLKEYPAELKALKEKLHDLAGLDGRVTYQQAAVFTYKLLHSGNVKDKETGAELMYILALPPIGEYRRRKCRCCENCRNR